MVIPDSSFFKEGSFGNQQPADQTIWVLIPRLSDYLAWVQDDPLSFISLNRISKPCELMITPSMPVPGYLGTDVGHSLEGCPFTMSFYIMHNVAQTSLPLYFWRRMKYYNVAQTSLPLYFWRRMKYYNVAQTSPGSQSCWLLHLMLLFVLQVMTE